MPKKILNFEDKMKIIIQVIQKKGGKTDYRTLFNHIKKFDIWRTNPSETITSALISMANEEIITFLDRDGKDVTEEILDLGDDKRRKTIRTENLFIKINYNNKIVEEIVKKFGVFEIPYYINKVKYDFIASADILIPRLGSIAVMWKRAIIVEVSGYRIWMCIRKSFNKELKFYYISNGEPILIPRLADLIEKNLSSIELSNGVFGELLNAKIHFYSEIPYNSGFIMSSAISALLSVGIRYLKEPFRASRCTLVEDYRSEKREVLEDAIAIADNVYLRDKWPIPSTTSTSAEYLLIFGDQKPGTVFCYRSGENVLKPEVHSYHFDNPLFTDIWTGPGHDFLEILKSIKKRSESLPEAEKFFEKIADDLFGSVWHYGKEGLDLIQKGLLTNGFNLLKNAIYEQICNSLRFTFEYFSYPHIATLAQILGQYGKYGSPVGVGGGGFFQLLNENFKRDEEFAKLLLEVCRDWCIHHGGRVVRKPPYILKTKENRNLWGIIVHKT